jgi:hypothetical protein
MWRLPKARFEAHTWSCLPPITPPRGFTASHPWANLWPWGSYPAPAAVLVGGDRDSSAAPLPADGDALWFRGLTLGQP